MVRAGHTQSCSKDNKSAKTGESGFHLSRGDQGVSTIRISSFVLNFHRISGARCSCCLIFVFVTSFRIAKRIRYGRKWRKLLVTGSTGSNSQHLDPDISSDVTATESFKRAPPDTCLRPLSCRARYRCGQILVAPQSRRIDTYSFSDVGSNLINSLVPLPQIVLTNVARA